MRKASDSTQLITLRREMKQVVRERQEWATRAGVTGRALAKAEAEVAEWKARFDTVLNRAVALLVNNASPEACREIARQAAHSTDGLGNPFPALAVSRETEGKP